MDRNSKTVQIARIALLIALEIVLSRFLSIPTPIAKIGFAFIPLSIIGMLYGPFYTAIAAGIADFIGATLFPVGPYFPGYTLTAALSGLVYGFFLQKKGAKSFLKIITAVVIVNIVLRLGLNTLWTSIVRAQPYWVIFFKRAIKNIIMIPVEIIFIKIIYEKFISNMK